jgi:hypothetical protein
VGVSFHAKERNRFQVILHLVIISKGQLIRDY